MDSHLEVDKLHTLRYSTHKTSRNGKYGGETLLSVMQDPRTKLLQASGPDAVEQGGHMQP